MTEMRRSKARLVRDWNSSNASTSSDCHHHVRPRGGLNRAAPFAEGQETSREIWFRCAPSVASLVRWYLSVLDSPDNTKKRKRAEESDSDTPEPASDSDDQDAGGGEEDEEPRKSKSKRKATSTKPKAAKLKAPPQKKPRIPKTASTKTGPKATKRTRKPKGGDTGEPFDAEKLAKDTHISGDNPLFSMGQPLLPGWY